MKTLLWIGVIVLVAAAAVGWTLQLTGRETPKLTESNPAVPEEVNWLAMMVKERAVIRRALQEPNLRETEWFKRNTSPDLMQLEQKLLDEVHVRVIPNTRLIEISFETDECHDAAPIVNSVAKVFLEWIRHTIKQETRSHLSTLQMEEAKLNRTMRLRNQELNSMSERVPGLRVGGPPIEISLRLREFRSALAKAEVEMAAAEAAMQEAPAAATRPANSSILGSQRKRLAFARRKTVFLLTKVIKAEADQKKLDVMITRFRQAEADYRGVRRLYEQISGRRRRLDIILGSPDNLNISLVGEALTPLEPVGIGRWRASARIYVGSLKPSDPMGQ